MNGMRTVRLGALTDSTSSDKMCGGCMHARPKEELSQLLISNWYAGVTAEWTGMQSLEHLSLELLTVAQPYTPLVTDDSIAERIVW